MNFDNYIFRASALGNIVSKSGKFTDGNKTYIEETFVGAIHNVRKEISSKYMEKGLFEEESGITLLNQTIYPKSILVKNKERKTNDFITGEADCIKDGIVYDIKNAWDKFTFGKSDLTHNYKWQLVGYMWLWEVQPSRLFYCLNNTPEHILVGEERKLFYSGNFLTFEDKEYLAKCEELRKRHNYDNMKLYERFKLWDVQLLEGDIETLKKSIVNAREYMSQLWLEHEAQILKNKKLMNLL